MFKAIKRWFGIADRDEGYTAPEEELRPTMRVPAPQLKPQEPVKEVQAAPAPTHGEPALRDLLILGDAGDTYIDGLPDRREFLHQWTEQLKRDPYWASVSASVRRKAMHKYVLRYFDTGR